MTDRTAMLNDDVEMMLDSSLFHTLIQETRDAMTVCVTSVPQLDRRTVLSDDFRCQIGGSQPEPLPTTHISDMGKVRQVTLHNRS